MLHSGPHAFRVAQSQLFPPGKGKASVGKMIDRSRYGEGLACRDMADGALVIVIEGTRGDVTRRGPHTHQATGAFVGTSVSRGWDREDF